MSALRGLALPRTIPGLRRLTRAVRGRRPSARAAGIVLAILIVLGLGWLWFRDSGFVSVNRVQVTGLSGPQVRPIRSALINSAMTMSTLDVDMNQLRQAVEQYPDVRTLSVSSQFPHGLVIHVDEEIPVAEVSIGGRAYALDSRGVLLRQPSASDGQLPSVSPTTTDATGSRLSDSGARAALAVLGSAPFAVLAHIQNASYTGTHGVVIKLRNGPSLYFGTAQERRAKWDAAIAVLGNPKSAGASYIDVSIPNRPAAGVTPIPGAVSSASSPSTSG